PFLEHCPAVNRRHHDVEHDQLGMVGGDLLERFEPVVRGVGLISLGFQAELQHPHDLRLVVDDENTGGKIDVARHLLRLRLTWMTAPSVTWVVSTGLTLPTRIAERLSRGGYGMVTAGQSSRIAPQTIRTPAP